MKNLLFALISLLLTSCAGLTVGEQQPLDLTKLEKQLAVAEAGATNLATVYAGTDREADMLKVAEAVGSVRTALLAVTEGQQGDLSLAESIDLVLATVDQIVQTHSDDQDLRAALVGFRVVVDLIKIELENAEHPPQPPPEEPTAPPGAAWLPADRRVPVI